MMQETKHIIEKFWAGTATDAEKQLLADRIMQDEQAWKELLQREYDQHRNSTEKPLTDEQSGRVLARLHRQIPGDEVAQPKAVFFRNWFTWAAAAVLVLVAGWGIYQYNQTNRPSPTVARQQARRPWQLTRQTNTSETVMNVTLADGSTLELQPGSTVSYYDPFGRPSRNISLTGEALFTVAKDTEHPFVVLANGFTTTALGTRFRVRATEPNRLSVQLLEGRVVVRATPQSGLKMNDMYLKPGQEVNVNTKTKQVSIDQFDQNRRIANRLPAVTPAPVAVPGLTFTKEPLNNVFAELGKRYNVQIDYDPADVQGLSFSGTFESADSLRVVLGAVCTMNDLSFKQEAGKVTVRKSP